MIINDGTGTGNQAKVNGDNQLEIHAVQLPEERHINVAHANAYNINTESITLTSANKTAILYLKNNDAHDLIVTAVVIGLGPSTGGVANEEAIIVVTRNPTGGTITDTPTNAPIIGNRNYGSNNTLTADVYKGAEGETLTGDTNHIYVFQKPANRVFVSIEEVLPKGASLGIDITPPTSNSSMTCYAAVICYLKEDL